MINVCSTVTMYVITCVTYIMIQTCAVALCGYQVYNNGKVFMYIEERCWYCEKHVTFFSGM